MFRLLVILTTDALILATIYSTASMEGPLLLCLDAVLVVAIAIATSLIATRLWGLFYAPTLAPQLTAAMLLARPRKGELFVDLGCGDGRVMAAAARMGARAVGYEINPFLVAVSRLRTWWLGLGDRAQVRMSSFWDADLSGADVVFVFGLPPVMERLEHKLERSLNPGCRIVSTKFLFPTWTPERILRGVILYRVPAR